MRMPDSGHVLAKAKLYWRGDEIPDQYVSKFLALVDNTETEDWKHLARWAEKQSATTKGAYDLFFALWGRYEENPDDEELQAIIAMEAME